jgi:hypothetical protein
VRGGDDWAGEFSVLGADASEESRLALGSDGEAVVGVGRRVFVLDGEDTIDMMDLQSLRFG